MYVLLNRAFGKLEKALSDMPQPTKSICLANEIFLLHTFSMIVQSLESSQVTPAAIFHIPKGRNVLQM